jgi:predicted AlkP superfamily phosphohydrolase/phosphomutase
MPRPIAIIGLDCAPPRLVLDEFRGEMPNLAGLMASGSFGPLRSCHPPITVPAWSCLASGYDAGQLGIYGFRNRASRGYEEMSIAFSPAVKKPRLWDYFSAAGRTSICLGVPQTFPIEGPPRGIMVADFLTPDKTACWVHPPDLAGEIERAADGDYPLDVRDFRTEDKARLLAEIREGTRRRFQAATHLAARYPFDLFFMVEMGTDRLHHGFWHFGDPAHPRFPGEGEGNPFRYAMRDYYRELDGHLGRLLAVLPKEALVLVVSDHGARAMHGGVAVNEWLVQQGYLALREYPLQPTPLAKLHVDWERTIAWSEGGYYARVFLNVAGREPQGKVPPADYEPWRDRLIAELEAIPLKPEPTRVYRPEALFRECRGVAPDLVCYFGNLSWRSVGTVGWRDIFVDENDTGPDEANHDWEGVFISSRPLVAGQGHVEGLALLDVGVSVLKYAGLPVPKGCVGCPSIVWQ